MTRHSQGKYCSPEHQREGIRASARKHAENNRESIRAYHRELYKRNTSETTERVKKYRQTEAGKAMVARVYKAQKEKNPHKVAARQAVLIAVRSGRLTKQPCEKCGEKKVQAHHDDYSKPLEVRWLCARCHHIEHGTLVIDRKVKAVNP